MLAEPQVTARYIEPITKRKILRDRRDGVKLWRIARDTGLSIDVVREVLIANGYRRVQLCNKSEVRT